MKKDKIYLNLFFVYCFVLLISCKGEKAEEKVKKGSETAETSSTIGQENKNNIEAAIRRDKLDGGPYPALLVTQSRFLPADDGSGKNTKPGPARLLILRKKGNDWQKVIIDDPDSNVFHKAMQMGNSILTAGATGAWLKLWTFNNGNWKSETLWNPKFGGKFDRLRDFEIGRVMPGGMPQITVATHDQGVVAVVVREGEKWKIIEIDKKPDTFVHEIELADIDGDGINEIFATPSMPNVLGKSQSGEIVMYKWKGKNFEKTLIKKFDTRHVKEILATTLKGEKKPVLFAAVEAELEKIADKTKIKTPVEIFRFSFDEKLLVTEDVVASIFDAQMRFLVEGDVDNDGKSELIASAMKTGIWLIRPAPSLPWQVTNFERESSGFEHATCLADLDKDGKPEIYVAADDQKELSMYTWNGSGFDKKLVIPLEGSVITWNIMPGNI